MNESDYVRLNRENWTRQNAAYTDAQARAAWSQPEIAWGVWQTPERSINSLPDVAGKDVIELGCGTAYVAAWLKRAGARRVVGVDITPAQLETAQRMNQEFGAGLELIEANAESVPLRDASFDLAVSEYGASIWCDPYKWIPEASRLLRSGGELVFLRTSTLSLLCSPDEGPVGDRLVRPYRSLGRIEWPEEASVEFHIGAGDLIRLLREVGFDIIAMFELLASEDATDHSYYSYVPAQWAKAWPAEEMWRARKR